MTINISLTKRVRRRKLTSGEIVEQLRYVLNWRDPRTGSRQQRFFERQKEAQDKRAELTLAYQMGNYSVKRESLTVGDAVAAWLDNKRDVVRANTYGNYEFQARYVVGPMPTTEARKALVALGKRDKSTPPSLTLLGKVKTQDLTTRQIREWHRMISQEVSVYSANKALMILKAALALAAEDYEFRPPAMPTGLQRRTDNKRKEVLTPDQVHKILVAAKSDPEKGVYYAVPFLMGTRPSEQLGLMWDSVDFEANLIRIERIQLKGGALSELTKTEAGRREIPMSPQLREMLLEWRVRCPRREGKLERVFPAPGLRAAWPLHRMGGGGPLIYNNFRKRFWAPAIRALDLRIPAMPPRHTDLMPPGIPG